MRATAGEPAALPNYRNSGVEWLGDVPAHWGLGKLRHLCDCLDGRRVPLNAAERLDRQGDIPYWGANGIVDYVNEALFDEDLVLLGEDGAPFLEPDKAIAFYIQGKVWPNNHVHVLRPNIRGTGKFVAYCLNVTNYAPFIDGSTRDKLTQGAMNEIPVPWPPIEEQGRIAAFLDAEAAKIDTLIAEQRRLVELLKEKRQAVISHAVTKGLDPSAPMKPSGVEWLGAVPRHWRVVPLKRIAKIQTGIAKGKDHVGKATISVPYLRVANVQDGYLDLNEIAMIEIPVSTSSRLAITCTGTSCVAARPLTAAGGW